MAKINIANGIISSSADYGLYRGTSKIVNIQDGEFRVLGDLIAENYIFLIIHFIKLESPSQPSNA